MRPGKVSNHDVKSILVDQKRDTNFECSTLSGTFEIRNDVCSFLGPPQGSGNCLELTSFEVQDMSLLIMCNVLQVIVESCGEAGISKGLDVPHGERLLVEFVLEMLKL